MNAKWIAKKPANYIQESTNISIDVPEQCEAENRHRAIEVLLNNRLINVTLREEKPFV